MAKKYTIVVGMDERIEVDLVGVRERRYQLADILNSNLLAAEARAEFGRRYADTGRILEEAARDAAKG